MARSARELFEEAMRLDPQERAALMRLLIETLDAESEEGVEDAWRVEVERRMAELDSGAVEEASEVAAITRRYDCGLLAEPGKPRDLADKILVLYHDRPLAARLGVNARRAALDFDRPRQVKAYYELFRALVADSSDTAGECIRR